MDKELTFVLNGIKDSIDETKKFTVEVNNKANTIQKSLNDTQKDFVEIKTRLEFWKKEHDECKQATNETIKVIERRVEENSIFRLKVMGALVIISLAVSVMVKVCL